MPGGSRPVYGFGPFVLDVADRSLKRDGAPISLPPKQFDLLASLVENAGRLVEKEALLATVWPDVTVEEGNLTKGVFGLRQALDGDDGSQYIATVPKRGYPFVPPVSTKVDDAGRPTPGEPTAAPSESSIAVMPFSDMSAGRDQDFFCEGMSEEIINALGRVPDVRVA